jgi:hypothetical protein
MPVQRRIQPHQLAVAPSQEQVQVARLWDPWPGGIVPSDGVPIHEYDLVDMVAEDARGDEAGDTRADHDRA